MSYSELPTRCKNALSRYHNIGNEAEFLTWAKTATANHVKGMRTIGETSERAIATAVHTATKRIIGRLSPPNTGKGLTKSYPADEGFVYVMHSPRMGAHKVGFSSDPESRLAQLRLHVPDIRLVHSVRGTGLDEANAHQQLKSRCIGGEWFNAPVELIIAALPRPK